MMDRSEILNWLRETDSKKLKELWVEADRIRKDVVGDEVHLRGLIEISNHCIRQCLYCGIRASNHEVERYRIPALTILECAGQAKSFGCGTTVLQAGEDPGITREWMSNLIRSIKDETGLAVTLSLGEREETDYAEWHEAGADRYLLRFETSNSKLFHFIHPSLPGRTSDRLMILKKLEETGYEIGSGVMIGIPGQTYHDLAKDIELFSLLELDMVGIGPYIPHPATPLGETLSTESSARRMECDISFSMSFSESIYEYPDQVPNTELMTYKVIALTRIACPSANIPSTAALATLNRRSGRELGLMRGANVIMPNLTPLEYRAKYEIYPAKADLFESSEEWRCCMKNRIAAIGRRPGEGRGDSRRKAKNA